MVWLMLWATHLCECDTGVLWLHIQTKLVFGMKDITEKG